MAGLGVGGSLSHLSNFRGPAHPAIYQPRSYGAIVALPGAAGVDALVALHRQASGTRIEYAERIPALSPKWMTEDVLLCL